MLDVALVGSIYASFEPPKQAELNLSTCLFPTPTRIPFFLDFAETSKQYFYVLSTFWIGLLASRNSQQKVDEDTKPSIEVDASAFEERGMHLYRRSEWARLRGCKEHARDDGARRGGVIKGEGERASDEQTPSEREKMQRERERKELGGRW